MDYRAALRVNPAPTYRYQAFFNETDTQMMVRMGLAQIADGATMSVECLVNGVKQKKDVWYHPYFSVKESGYRMADGGGIGFGMEITCPTQRGDILAEAVGTILPHGQTSDSHFRIILEDGRHMDCDVWARKGLCVASMCNDYRGLHHHLSHHRKPDKATQNCKYVQFQEYPGRVFLQGTKTNPGDENLGYYGDTWPEKELLKQVVRPRVHRLRLP
jgi:hypothetical protein